MSDEKRRFSAHRMSSLEERILRMQKIIGEFWLNSMEIRDFIFLLI